MRLTDVHGQRDQGNPGVVAGGLHEPFCQLIGPQCVAWIDACGSSRRHVGRARSRACQQAHHACDCHRIGWRDAEQQGLTPERPVVVDQRLHGIRQRHDLGGARRPGSNRRRTRGSRCTAICGSRRRFLVLSAVSRLVPTTIRSSASTLHVIGDICGEPSRSGGEHDRVVLLPDEVEGLGDLRCPDRTNVGELRRLEADQPLPCYSRAMTSGYTSPAGILNPGFIASTSAIFPRWSTSGTRPLRPGHGRC